ncbi:MAG: sigma-70 family RNA polymerase sigma factor [Kofleriaceae bacterium]
MSSLSATLDELAAETTRLRRLARSLVRDSAAAEDLVQDAYVVAALHAPVDGRPLRPWLVRVLVNLTRMRGRSAHHRRAREHAVAELAAAPATPAELVGRLEVHRLLAGLVLELAPAAREVVLLHYVEGLSSIEIANRLGLAAGTVRWRLKQAIDELRERLDHREPNRAWLPALAAFAGPPPATGIALPWLVLAAIALLLGMAWLVVQVRSPAEPSVASRAPVHERSSASVALAEPSTPGGRSPGVSTAVPAPFAGSKRTVEGRVVDAQQRAVAGAEVTLDCQYGEAGDALPHTTSNARGGFTFEVDARCIAVVAATKDDRLGLGDAYPSSLHALPLVLVLAPKLALAVHVVDAETGAPIEGAVVATASRAAAAFRNSATTNHAGDAQLALPAPPRVGPQRLEMFGDVVARAPRHLPALAQTELGADRITPVVPTIRLARGIAIGGQLVGAGSYADATIEIVGPMASDGPVGDGVGWIRRKGDDAEPVAADGRFELYVKVPGRYWLAPHMQTLAASVEAETIVEVGAGGRDDVVIHLGPKTASGVAGLVVDPAGVPVAGATVTTPSGLMKPILTDARGQFAIPMGAGPYRILARSGALASEVVPIAMHHGQLIHLTIKLGPTGIAGVVVDRAGTPVAGADVWRNTNDTLGLGERTTSDAQGRFAFDLPRGDFVLSVRRSRDDDFEDDDDVHVTSGTHDVRLVVP